VTPRTIIEKKRNSVALSENEMEFFVRSYIAGEIADYHAAALLMAICINGMNAGETAALTRVMRDSGVILDLSSLPGKKIDKHSTGGVGDKTSLLLAPIAAACGVKVPMVTGRGLGHTGGTLDKLQSISGFDPYLTPRRILSVLANQGAVLVGQTEELAPADRRFYALRDATGTVESIPLITASILSKKLAEGIDGLVLDVKTGAGAFMTTTRQSLQLARSLMETCRRLRMQTTVLVTDMSQPLGCAVGNALEVRECLDFMEGRQPHDLATVTFALAAHMILLGGAARTEREAARMAQEAVSSGVARRRFFEIVQAQGGDVRVLENPDLLPKASHVSFLKASRRGQILRADARKIGDACNALGAGRTRLEDLIDPAVGVYLRKKVGDKTSRGEELCEIHWNEETRFRAAMPLLEQAFEIGRGPAKPRPLIHKVLR
jgi:pyrimidine-nucleoside phosphorylase/thymidine phosphorylase